MSTTSAGIQALYEDIVASLIAHYDNFVLLPNPAILTHTYDIAGAMGNTVKVPITNAWAPGSTVSEGGSVITASARDFNPGSIQVEVAKRGAGTFVTEESLEDGGLAQVQNAVLNRLSRAIAQATDVAGFARLAGDLDAALEHIEQVDLVNDGVQSGLTTADCSFVMSPEALAYAMKREPTVKMWNDVDRDRYEMVATVRNGFKRIPHQQTSGATFYARAIMASSDIAASSNTASLDMVSRAVANLRKLNAPTDDSGFFMAVVSPAHEFHLAKELNGIGGISSGSIGNISQDLANQALLDGLIGQAVGCRFIRSNNVPTGLVPEPNGD